MSSIFFSSPVGPLRLHLSDNHLTHVELLSTNATAQSSAETAHHPVCDELQAYFENSQYRFRIPVKNQGTPFQQRVWQALTQIPAGTTLTYGDLAKQLGTSARAVGNACRANPTPIVVPCHRIVAKQSLGDFAGKTAGKMITIKQWLLAHESA